LLTLRAPASFFLAGVIGPDQGDFDNRKERALDDIGIVVGHIAAPLRYNKSWVRFLPLQYSPAACLLR
jgi:hypothetical protein